MVGRIVPDERVGRALYEATKSRRECSWKSLSLQTRAYWRDEAVKILANYKRRS